MPRKAKDEEVKKSSNKVNKSTATKKTSTKKSVATTKNATKGTKTNKTTMEKKESSTKKSVSKKVDTSVEYYDLPVAYNKTIVKILAQTPFCLFVYWEISKDDQSKFKKQYGENFFQDTRPYLVITNETMNYSFEIEINDYSNSWYINIKDSDCKYTAKLIRKPINNEIPNLLSSIETISSNEIDAPNDHILFDKLSKTIFFKNVENNTVTSKDISSFSFISNIGRIYNIYDFYKEIYQDELNGDELGAGLSSSQFSSTFK